jgi:hypothetical protein
MKTLKTSLVMLVVIVGMNLGTARANQPAMHSALSHLRSARAALESALADKGGHRERAISLVDRAIAETEAGIRYAAPIDGR